MRRSIPECEELQCIDLGINAITPVSSVAFRPDGKQLAVGTGSGTIRKISSNQEIYDRTFFSEIGCL